MKNGHRLVSQKYSLFIIYINSNFLYKILLLGDSGVGKSCIILQYTENNFSQNLMNSIGVDFKLKSIEVDGKIIKLQIVRKKNKKNKKNYFNFLYIVGYCRTRKIPNNNNIIL